MKKINIGDEVVSIHNFRRIKKYDIVKIKSIYSNGVFERSFSFENKGNIFYKSNYFISLEEYIIRTRKKKLIKLKEKINEKNFN